MREEITSSIRARAQDLQQELVNMRRKLHSHPELGFEETQTAKLICKKLDQLGVKYQSGVAGTGIVGVIEGCDSGPTVGLRADMDALPISEESRKPYMSKISGVMHACGHDAHVACLLGAIEVLVELRKSIRGCIKFIFQPAEEIDLGAKAIIAAGGLKYPKPDAFFALHCNPDIPVGYVGLRSGIVMASIDNIRIEVTGLGGHGAMPQKCVDSIVAASALVMNLQTVTSRAIDPLKPVVMTVGTFRAGTASNIIAEKAELTGSIRCLDSEVQQLLPNIIQNICDKTALTFGADVELDYENRVPVLINSKSMTDIVRRSTLAVLGEDKVLDIAASMGGDDFAFILKEVPGTYFHLGVGSSEKTRMALHNSQFDIDESCLSIGAAVLASSAMLALEELQQQG